MKAFLLCIVLSVFASLFSEMLFAQGETAVPFLLIPSSPSANGWGEVSTCVVSDNPMATINNPGQLGLFSLNNYFSASTYTPKTEWLPGFAQSDHTYNVSALNAGVNLSHVFDLRVPVSIGVGYSSVFLNLGTFMRTGPNGPNPIGTFHAYEKAERFSIAFGLDYFVRLGVGMSFDNILSSLSPLGTEQEQGTGVAKISATDFGVLLDVPIIDILEKVKEERIRLADNVFPLVNLSAGYAHQNHGGSAIYIDAAQSDPLPRSVIIGLSAELGVTMDVYGHPWKLLTFTLAREAEDLLVVRNSSTYEYQSGLGDISFFKHVVQGKLDNNERPNLHKGWQLNFGEFIYVREGSFTESPNFGNRNFTTSGIGIRLGGFVKFLEALSTNIADEGVLSFIADHFDIGYDHAEYATNGPLGGTTFNALSLTLK